MRLLLAATIPGTLRGFYLPFAEHFRSKGWRVDGIAQGISECQACSKAFDNVIDIEWSRNPLHLRNLLKAPATLRRIVREGSYDIVHVSTPVASFVTGLALSRLRREAGLTVIRTAHGFLCHDAAPRWKNLINVELERLMSRWNDYLTVMNIEDVKHAARYRMIPPNRLVYIPGVGVDLSKYSPEAVSPASVIRLRTELGLVPKQPLLFMAAEFIPRKRHADVLRAFRLVRHPSVRLALAGSGPLMGPMKRLAAELGIHERTLFLGERRDVPECIRASCATILASEREGLSRSILESLALAVPVIASDIRGNRDLLGSGAGLLIPVGNVEGLAVSMDWILEHPSEAAKMGESGRDRMAGFDLATVIDMHEELYRTAEGTASDRTHQARKKATAVV